jgi:hypothetical protein
MLMWRVIVLISYFADHQSRLRSHVTTFLAALGLRNTSTGTWESAAVPAVQAATELSRVLQAVANPQALPGVRLHTTLRHMWIYLDRA